MKLAIRLSKSRFTAGLQCHRQLWWKVHEPDAPELVPDVATRKILDQGTRVGELARAYVPGGTLIDLPHDAFDARLEATRAALAAGAEVLYEASFVHDGVYVAVDVLERTDHGFRLIEVKSSTRPKDVHIHDAALQAHVVAGAGYPVAGVEIMHLNSACTAPDLSDLFTRSDVTTQVDDIVDAVPGQIEALRAMLSGPLPKVAIGAHCTVPYECDFRARCWAGVPEHHVTSVYLAGRKAWEWVESGYDTILDLPGTAKMSAVAKRQWRAVRLNQRLVEPGLADALAALPRPLAYLDFETVMPAVPRWDGCHPYTQVPVQFSCHKERADGGHDHVAWLADGPEDPRPGIARAVVAACAGAQTILAYNAAFEKKCLATLAECDGVDDILAARLRELVPKVQDLLPIVREHVYDPAFGGSFGLKSVVPALVPDFTYADLAIQDGQLASALLDRLVADIAPEEREQIRADVLAYCERDTWATVRLFEVLSELG